MNPKLVLEKLGEALYTHKALIKQARKAKNAVDYFKKIGVFDSGNLTEAKKEIKR